MSRLQVKRTYISKGYVFDDEVTRWLNKLKAAHGSYNKGLRGVMARETAQKGKRSVTKKE